MQEIVQTITGEKFQQDNGKKDNLSEKVLGSKWIAVELGLEMIPYSAATLIKHLSCAAASMTRRDGYQGRFCLVIMANTRVWKGASLCHYLKYLWKLKILNTHSVVLLRSILGINSSLKNDGWYCVPSHDIFS